MKHTWKLVATLVVGAVALVLAFGLQQPMAAQVLVTVAGSLVALSMFFEMIKTLRSGKYGVDLLAIMAIVATLAVGEYWASLMVLVMLTGGDSLEDYATRKAGQELKSLLDNSPQNAHLVSADRLEDIAVEKIAVGDQLLVKPGELVPVDSKIIKGNSTFDESSLTGESRPLEKLVGSELMSGSVNGAAAVTIEALSTAADSQYQTIVQLVKESANQPANFVRMADRYAVPFTAIAIVIAVVAWLISGDPVRLAEVLVVASPCPLILAAPISLVAGMSRASKNGVIVKTGTTIEKLASAKTIAFDKTGTLTKGQLTVNEVKPIEPWPAQELLHFAASAEQRSGHVLARSLVAYVGVDGLGAVSQLSEVTGQGIEAIIDDQVVKVGKLAFVTQQAVQAVEQTAVYVSIGGKYAGYISFLDQLRPEAAATIQKLRHFGLKHIMMLTGDQATIAKTIAAKLDLDEVHGNLLPKDKIRLLQAVDQNARPTIMVGDGVNDAPSLTTADVGIAMGAHGATAASESADVVILKDDLSRVASAVMISQETMQIARNDVLAGIVVLVILMLIAATGVIPALVGAMFQEVVDMMTILLALRARKGLRRKK
ncbi:cadmium-translocating P-type ATPase [Lactiplantibacillus plantarum]|jgi:heavy metal translocating P-type ATPase|uniref:heavy metal translocating P-type ATPase n=1 Tax=Lactiplantibacillus plantarum TaxID=1590 RepID=UPI000863609D|nr:heavy metal translocating P-type ATPase [Lactiplantibacillus plantarum]MCG0599324.1 cadmium-translocating P-type ATPase [Lactiplantibacillus plantarum]MCG0876244.1 cadmium-translocating P-type ATPase [Lactiplantibacillus plantarum]MCG0902933.1 cadmium-translocating P-type ATPase [Lactiplantibacillus plantarum]MCG0905623.1 cadmium-translocating P-type ATPase [Lactiplantibacillus plantarum]MCG0909162.1 cadmium-translocating P-type ATPase [Lactiplantibacillus plantarum]